MTKRIAEAEMAAVVRTILRHRPNKTATFAELREEVPRHVKLSRSDRVKSPSRPGEEVWEQIIRNLVSHKHEGFVSVKGGMRLQWTRGRRKTAAKTAAKPSGRKAHAHANGYQHAAQAA